MPTAPSTSPDIKKTVEHARLDFPAFDSLIEDSGVLTQSVSDAMKSFLESDGTDDVASSFFLVKLQASQALQHGGSTTKLKRAKAAVPTAKPRDGPHEEVANVPSTHPAPRGKQRSTSPACSPTFASLPQFAPACNPHEHRNEALDRYVLDWNMHVSHDGDMNST